MGGHSDEILQLTLNIWRQSDADDPGEFETHSIDASPAMSFLEMLDVVNENLQADGREPVAFDHDCREGICGMCSLVINGKPHGPESETTTCQLHMRSFSDGDVIWIEPFRAKAFPVLRDLIIDRSPLDRIIQAGGFVSINTGAPQDANAIPIAKE
ncbi:MAG: 2Fe-2S iron-sulfur cluster-binding protein, partial [Planctomycetota bacterium]|nr:2Fe-2S iron-sulfur cluster-binding protein [Planctomycetota bacterium]